MNEKARRSESIGLRIKSLRRHISVKDLRSHLAPYWNLSDAGAGTLIANIESGDIIVRLNNNPGTVTTKARTQRLADYVRAIGISGSQQTELEEDIAVLYPGFKFKESDAPIYSLSRKRDTSQA